MAVEVGAPAPSPARSESAATDVASVVEARDMPGAAGLRTPQSHAYNTSNLGLRVAADASAALSAGALVAPLITMIDKAIIENASGRQALGASLRASATTLLLRPHHFLLAKPFRLILALYAGTYMTANALDTASATLRNDNVAKVTTGPAKFLATSSANLSLCLYKDSQFTKLFGSATTARPVPGPTYALFAARDCLTVFASFNLPPLIAPALPLSEAATRHVSAMSVAQFLAPAGVQLVSTPLHLLGLDLYNRNGAVAFGERMRKVRLDWLKSSVARMARIIPAFGVGGVVNTRVRANMMSKLE